MKYLFRLMPGEIAFLCLLSAFLVVSAPAAAAELNITFESQTVVASGVTPGANAAVFGVLRIQKGYVSEIKRIGDLQADANSDGIVTFTTTVAIPLQSILVVVDLADGRYVIKTPSGMPLRQREVPPAILQSGGGGLAEAILDNRELLELFLARPGTGAWQLTVGDGGITDADGVDNASVKATFSQVVPIGSSPAPPNSLNPNDIFVAIDPARMDILSLRFSN